jgi:TonB family protein
MSLTKRVAVRSLALALCIAAPATADTAAPSPIVKACVDSKGQLETAEIVESSNHPEIDAAALKVVRASRYAPASDKKQKKGKSSCIKFRVKFVLKDGEPVPEGS